MTTIPIPEQLKEIRREIAVRERVYPRWIAANRITQHEADRKLEILRAVAETLLALSRKEELPL